MKILKSISKINHPSVLSLCITTDEHLPQISPHTMRSSGMIHRCCTQWSKDWNMHIYIYISGRGWLVRGRYEKGTMGVTEGGCKYGAGICGELRRTRWCRYWMRLATDEKLCRCGVVWCVVVFYEEVWWGGGRRICILCMSIRTYKV